MNKQLSILLLISCTSWALAQTCTCAHIVEGSQCQLSPKCNWSGSICITNENYIDSQSQGLKCSNYLQEDCRLSKACAFHLGKCIDFTTCTDYVIEQCNQSSVSCASDGQQCHESKPCQKYQTQVECKNRDLQNNLCCWNKNQEIKCQQVSKCEELPISFRTHKQCQNELENCTLKKGGGCQTIPNDCSELKFKEQCYITIYSEKKCFWDSKRALCLHKICPNAIYKTEDECQEFNTECTTDGQTCIYIAQCSEYLTKIACKYNILGKQCIFLNGVCLDRECDKAPSNYISQLDCAQFIKGKECVPKKQGGCQEKPPNCEGFQTADSCFQQDDGKPCIWKVDHCKIRECMDAPIENSNQQCKEWENCIGSPNGGCVDKPLICEGITLLQACEYDLAGFKCFVDDADNKCKRMSCSGLTLPVFDSHLKCNSILDLCTFNPMYGGCVEYACSNIYETSDCIQDANSLPCRVVQGCVSKTCKNAPYTLTTHQECQGWMSSCTVQYHKQEILVYFKGCEDVKYECQGYHQEQCFVDSQGFKCKWENQQCLYITCQDAPKTITTMQGCLDWKVSDLCLLDDVGFGCKFRPLTCSGLANLFECQIGLIDTICIWNSTQCEDRGCGNAPTTYSTNQECRSWLPECNLANSGFGCLTAQINQECELQQNYNNHSDCHSWNTQCTIAPRIMSQGCVGLKQCSEYLSENQCQLSVNRTNCEWNSSEMVCLEKVPQQCDMNPDLAIFTRLNCEQFQLNCTINDFNSSCIDKKSNCSDYTNVTECTSTITQSKCIWNGSCIDMTCSMNTTAILESECMTYIQYNYCQLKVLDSGEFGIGCENREINCDPTFTQQKCNKTILQNLRACIYLNDQCQFQFQQAGNSPYWLDNVNSQQKCQYYMQVYVLSVGGIGCHRMNTCNGIPESECNQTIIQNNINCKWSITNNYCLQFKHYLFIISSYNCQYFQDQSTCENVITIQDGKCEWIAGLCLLKACNSSIILTTEECISLSPTCYFNVQCMMGQNCQDFTQQAFQDPEYCNSRQTYQSGQNGQKCGWNGSQCQSRACSHQTTATGFDQSLTCYQWKYDCVSNDVGLGCKNYQNCNEISVYAQCKQNNCIWQYGQGCIQSLRCSLDTTSITQYECKLVHSNCDLNIFQTKGCTYRSCSMVPLDECNDIILNINVRCSWSGSNCHVFNCIDFTTNCLQINPNCYYNSATSKCDTRLNCSISTNELDCNLSEASGQACEWNPAGSSCNPITFCSQISNPTQYTDCYSKLASCTIQVSFSGSKCIPKTLCQEYSNENSCQVDVNGKLCSWDGTQCNDSPCFWNGSCQERTCSDYIGTTYSIQKCQAWLSGCTVKPTLDGCTEKTDCTQAPIEYNTHQLCNSYLPECTVSSTIPFCVPLISNCNYATQIQCHHNSLQQSCYWSDIQKRCLLLESCNIIDSTVSTYIDCEQILSTCTVSNSLSGCQTKKNCDLYTLEDQCHSTYEGEPCFWSNNQCIGQSCYTAPISSYTHSSCQSYFNQECQMNTDGTLCIKALSTCSGYNQIQCETVGSVNLDQIPCIWQNEVCIEYICQNGPIAATTIEECTTYSNMCTLGKCVDKLCEDFPYASDILCQMALPNFICTTNGSKCINRGECQEITNIAGCTYSKQGIYCEWQMNKCVEKTCQTAPNTIINDLECQNYFPGCTLKLRGGCTQMSTCNVAIVKEACNTDINQKSCLWDYSQEICVYAQCVPVCGDGILIAGYEDCEDGNSIPYDGCYNCQFSCQIGCEVCYFGKCIECSEGWRSVINGCETICGDGLVVGTEQCDDMNQVDHDGCSNCTFQCHEKCLICDKGKCYQCRYGWNIVEYQCATNCGDGIMSGNEKCDDGNLTSGDGCSKNCQEVEADWVCKQDQNLYSNCFYSVQSNLELKYLTTKRELVQEVQIKFTGEMKLKTTFKGIFKEFIQVTIEDVPVTDYLVEIQPIVPASTKLANISYQILITLLVQLQRPKLTIKLVDDILENQQGVGLDTNSQTIYLNSPIIMEASTLATVESTLSFNEIIVYCLLGLSGLSILTGDLLMFWNLLDLLQHLSYLMYINIDFPQHLQIYLSVFKKVTLKPLIDQLQIEDFVKKINNGKLPFIKSKTKSSNEEINAYFLLNAKGFFVVVLVAFLTQFIFKLMSSKYMYNWEIRFIEQTTLFYNQRTKLQYYVVKIRKLSNKNLRYFYYSGLIRVFITNQYLLNYSAFLQFQNPDFSNWHLATNTVLAYMTLISQFILLLWIFSKLQTRYVTNRSSYKIIFEDVKYRQWAIYYKALLIIRKVLYMGIIVLCQEEPAIQVFLLSINSGVFTVYLIFTKPLRSNTEFLKILFSEFLFSLITLSFFIYFLNISDGFFQLFGWIHIGMLSMILGIQLLIDLYSQVSKIIEKIKKYRESKLKLEKKNNNEQAQQLFM